MQAASEMYTKLQCCATDVVQAMEKYPFVQVVRQQLEYLLSHSPLNTFSAQAGTSTTVGSDGVSTRQEPEAVSTPHWTVGVAMELLKKLSTVPAFLTSTVHWATVTASRVINTVSAALKMVNSRIQGKTRSAEKLVQEETRNEESAPVIVNVRDSPDTEEVHAEQSAEPSIENALVYTEQAAEPSHVEDVKVCTEPAGSSHVETSVSTEEAAGSNTEEDEVHRSSHTVSADICKTQQPTAEVQSSTQEKSEANTAAARPRINTFFSLFRRSAAAQLPRES